MLVLCSLACFCGSAAYVAAEFGWLTLDPLLWQFVMGWLLAVSVVALGDLHAFMHERSRRIAVARIRGTRVPDIHHDPSAA